MSLTYTSLSLGSITGVQLQLASVSCSQSDRGCDASLLTCSEPTQTHTWLQHTHAVYPVPVLQGPLQSLTVDSIAWRSAAPTSSSTTSSQAGSRAGAEDQDRHAAAPWLPFTITGVTVVISKAAAGARRRKQQGGRSRGSRNPAAAAAARPAVSTVLAVARRLLPGVPITVKDVTVQLKVVVGGWVAGMDGCARGRQTGSR